MYFSSVRHWPLSRFAPKVKVVACGQWGSYNNEGAESWEGGDGERWTRGQDRGGQKEDTRERRRGSAADTTACLRGCGQVAVARLVCHRHSARSAVLPNTPLVTRLTACGDTQVGWNMDCVDEEDRRGLKVNECG
jgi:hypothetical protein